MNKIVGIRTLNKAITEAFSSITDVKFRWAEDWAFHYDKNMVTYALLENTIEDIWFNAFVEERFGYKVENNFMMTIMHELGHYVTGDDIDGMVYEFCLKEKTRISEEMQTADAERSKELEWQYFNLPDEIVATAWAVEFMTKEAEDVEAIWQKVLEALHKFYEKNITE